jgi:hypothetical protein
MDFSLITDLIASCSGVTSFLSIVGFLRLVNKPLFALLHSYVKSTSSEDDDKKLEGFMNSSQYKLFCFVLDWVTSVKLKNASTKDSQDPKEPKNEG